jgi:hypothetical protein
MHGLSPLALAGLLLLAPAARSQTSLTEHTRDVAEGATPPPATLAEVAWLAGVWVGEGLGGRIEEVWMPPSDGSMVCAFKSSGEDGVRFYELVTLTEEAGSVVMKLKHFHPDLTGWEEKDEVVDFPLVALEERAIYFSGATYRLAEPDLLKVYVAMSRKGEMAELEFTLRRVGSTAP